MAHDAAVARVSGKHLESIDSGSGERGAMDRGIGAALPVGLGDVFQADRLGDGFGESVVAEFHDLLDRFHRIVVFPAVRLLSGVRRRAVVLDFVDCSILSFPDSTGGDIPDRDSGGLVAPEFAAPVRRRLYPGFPGRLVGLFRDHLEHHGSSAGRLGGPEISYQRAQPPICDGYTQVLEQPAQHHFLP